MKPLNVLALFMSMKTLREMQQHNIKKEMEKVKAMKDQAAARAIEDFWQELVISGLSEERQYFLVQKLRILHEQVGIFPITPASVKKAMIWIRQKNFARWTVIGYQAALAKFWKSEASGAPNPMPLVVSDMLKLKRDRKHKLKANDLISPEELDKILDSCLTSRDKAIFSLLYDSGLRHNELLNLRNRDLIFDQYGAKVIVPEEGKTGTRMVRITSKDRSISFLMQWMRDHPRAYDDDAFLFCKVEQRNRGERIAYQDLNRILNDILKRGNVGRHFDRDQGKWIITKKIYPHLFRHTRATILAASVAQRPLEMQMGWVPGTSMLGTYAHLDESAQDEAILLKAGIIKEESKGVLSTAPVKCPICGNPNDYRARFCNTCGFVLDKNLAENKIQEEAGHIENEIMALSALDPQVKQIVKNAPVEQKEAALELVLNLISGSPELLEKVRREMARK